MLKFLGGKLLSWFSGLAGKFLQDSLMRFVALKTFIYGIVVTTVPLMIKNLIVWFFDEIVTATSTFTDIGEMKATVLSLSGAAGYLAYHLMLPDCISILITAVIIRFTMNFIPFL